MQRIIVAVLVVGGFIALALATPVGPRADAPDELGGAPARAGFLTAVPSEAGPIDRAPSSTGDARLATSFDRLPKPFASR